jgi:ubiquinone/menaquinone biosynthesis C-methylase UbiE
MNAGISSSDASIHYYDGDYPSPVASLYPENFDETTKYQGLAFDIDRYLALAGETGGPVLELCCGTGRVAIPLARSGLEVVGVDISVGMLRQLRDNLTREEDAVSERIALVEADVESLSIGREFPLAICAFNSLLCITDFEAQRAACRSIARHLRPGGVLALDIVNPLKLNIHGDPVPKPFFTRRNPHTGNTYTRFATMDAFDANHRQRLHGWYDEIDGEGRLRRQPYSMYWRPIFRFEIELMLEEAGIEIVALEGGHRQEPYTADSPRMFVVGRKR